MKNENSGSNFIVLAFLLVGFPAIFYGFPSITILGQTQAQDIADPDVGENYQFEPIAYRGQRFKTGGAAEPSIYAYCALSGPRRNKTEGNSEDKMVHMKVPELIVAQGHKFEEHHVITEDGYNLTLFRIFKDDIKAEFEPVFLQHGFLGSASDWLMMDSESVYENVRTLPATLVRFNFDVWLGNARGNEYSQGHVKYSSLDPRYWSFSWHEMGKYDIPSATSYILNVTKWNKMNYIGHSMGTTMFYVAASLIPEFNDQINTMVALAPSTSLNNTKSPARLLANITDFTKYFPIEGKLLPQIVLEVFRRTFPEQCTQAPLFGVFNVCESIVSLLIGANPDNFNGTTYRRIIAHLPSTTSIRTLLHYLQTIQHRDFRKCDFGPKENVRRYGAEIPPAYNLSLINVKTFNLNGKYDTLVVAEDVNNTLSALGKKKEMQNREFFPYNHLDFIWGDDVAPCVNREIISNLLRAVNCTAAQDPAACKKALEEAF